MMNAVVPTILGLGAGIVRFMRFMGYLIAMGFGLTAGTLGFQKVTEWFSKVTKRRRERRRGPPAEKDIIDTVAIEAAAITATPKTKAKVAANRKFETSVTPPIPAPA